MANKYTGLTKAAVGYFSGIFSYINDVRLDMYAYFSGDENIDNLKKNGFIVLGVSPDSEKSHLKFISKYNLSFDLIVDESKSICKLYGVWGPKKFMGREYDGVHRTTFLIDENGLIDKIITKVNTKNHTEQIL